MTIGFIGGTSPWIGPDGDGAMMDEPEAARSRGGGLGAGRAHDDPRRPLDARTTTPACGRSRDSRVELEGIAGAPVETFAYPFGRYGPGRDRGGARRGLIAAVTTGSGSWAPYEMTRAMIGRGRPPAGRC